MVDLTATITDGARLTVDFTPLPVGPFYFAWVDPGTEFNPAMHAVDELDIYEFEIIHNEGDFPALRVAVRNPRVGLIAPGRKRYAWFSWFNGTQVVPLFFGRILGIPDQIQNEVIEMNFIARPDDYEQQRLMLADYMKTPPYWDDIWFSPESRDNPDNLLESRPELWHVDRTSHQVTTSNIVTGEDGLILFSQDDVFYDSVQVTFNQNPANRVVMTAEVSWSQEAQGVLDISQQVLRQFGDGYTLTARAGDGFVQAFPKSGSNIGGGWEWTTAELQVIKGPIDPSIVGTWDTVGLLTPASNRYFDEGFDTRVGNFSPQHFPPIGLSYHIAIPLYVMKPTMVLGFSTQRRKKELLQFEIVSDIQPILTDPNDPQTIELSMGSSELIDTGAVTPEARSFFSTDRGEQSIQYLIAVARAQLIARARCVAITFETSFQRGVAEMLSCRKNAYINDPRLPGGEASGKITSYSLSLVEGRATCKITIGATTGKDGGIVEFDGEPTYVEDGYVETGYQQYAGAYVAPFAGDVAYGVINGSPPVDDGVDFNKIAFETVVEEMTGGGFFKGSMQEAWVGIFTHTVDAKTRRVEFTNIIYPTINIKLKSLQGSFETPLYVPTTQLKIPRTIDLEAGA